MYIYIFSNYNIIQIVIILNNISHEKSDTSQK